jgi:SAM-dependent methyltransferase
MGCGHVPLYGTYRDLVQENICIDWANNLHTRIHLDYALDLGGKLPFQDGSFDTVLLTDVLEHLPEPQDAMGEVGRILRWVGKLIIGVPFFYWIHEQPHDYHRYTEFALRRMCHLSGLSVVELLNLKRMSVFRRFSVISHQKALKSFHAPACTTSAISYCCAAFGRSVAGMPLSGWSKLSFPLGYVVVAEKRLGDASADVRLPSKDTLSRTAEWRYSQTPRVLSFQRSEIGHSSFSPESPRISLTYFTYSTYSLERLRESIGSASIGFETALPAWRKPLACSSTRLNDHCAAAE